MDSGEYLQDGFDPSKLRIADLRNIFLRHDVNYPSNAKKAEYVQIFKDEITPRAAVLRTQFESIEPTGRGIVDVEPRRRTRSVSPEKSPTKASAAATASLKSPAKRRSPKKSEKAKEAETPKRVSSSSSASAKMDDKKPDLTAPKPDEQLIKDPPASASPRRKGRKTLSKQQIVEPNAKDDVAKSATSSSASTAAGNNKTPSVIRVDSSNRQKHQENEDGSSPFSEKNIFQSGSPKTTPRKKRPHPFDAEADTEEKKAIPPKRRSKKSIKKEQTQGEAGDNSKKQETTPQQSEQSQFSDNKRENQTPGSIMRHFTSFSSTPDRDYNTPEITKKRQTMPATVQPMLTQQQGSTPPPSFQDHTFTEQRVNKRLSFMPSLENLKMSNEFSQQLKSAFGGGSPGSTSSNTNKDAAADTTSQVLEPQEEPKPEDSDVELKDKDHDLKKEEIIDQKVAELDDQIDQEDGKRASKKASKKKSKVNVWNFWLEKIFLLFTIGICLTGFAWWRQERIEVGYCNVGFVSHGDIRDRMSAQMSSSVWELVLNQFRPDCVPCPQHATCYPHFQAHCDEDFVYANSPFSFGGLIPLAPRCSPDTEKQRRVMIMTEKALELLRQRHADSICGEIEESATIEEDDLRHSLYSMKKPSISDHEFDELWRNTLKNLKQESEVMVDYIRKNLKGYAQNGDTEPEYKVKKAVFQSTSMAKLSFKCRIQRGISGSVERYRSTIELSGALIVILFVARWYYLKRQARNQQVQALSKRALEKLVEKQKASDADTKGLTVRYIPSAQLRDEELPDMDGESRMVIWRAVTKAVEANTNVRSQQKEVHGEIMRVWEWVGE